MWGVHPKVLELIRTDSLIKPEVQSRKSKWKKKQNKDTHRAQGGHC